MIRSILTICVGNICRSPMAEALLANELPNCIVQSAGVGALVGRQADPHARELMVERGLDIGNHRAKQLTRFHCMNVDLVLVMDAEQKRYVERFSPLTRGRVFRLGEFGGYDIGDPFGLGHAEFAAALELIENGVRQWVSRISNFGNRGMEPETAELRLTE